VAPAENRGGTLKVVGLVTGGVGVAALAGSVFFGLRAGSLADEVADTYSSAKVADGESANRTMIILAVAGGAALATGAVLYYLGGRGDEERATAVAPMVTPGLVGVSWQGRF
jgi:hypothetical protein